MYRLYLSRWWRAPEVYINQKHYREQLDIWSVGCIMAELILLQPAFRGADQKGQLDKMFDILGTPDLATLNEICTAGLYTNSNERC
jgi:serine/threonine protein kinase